MNTSVDLTLALALDLAAKGYRILPCREVSETINGETYGVKSPYLGKGGFYNASRDASQVREWWTRWPNALVGVSLDESDLTVIDVDVRPDVNGFDVIRDCGFDLPTAWKGGSWSGNGEHFWFRGQTPGGKPVRGVDRKSAKGYVVVRYPLPDPSDIQDPVPDWALPSPSELLHGSARDEDSKAWNGTYAEWRETVNLDCADIAVEQQIARMTQVPFDRDDLRDALWVAVKEATVNGVAGMPEAIDAVRQRWLTAPWDTAQNRARFDALLAGTLHQFGPFEGPRILFLITDEEIERWLAEDPMRDAVVTEDYDEPVFDPITGEEIAEMSPALKAEVQSILLRREANRLADELEDPRPLVLKPLSDLRKRTPPGPIWDGLLYKSTVAIVAADGGVGKTTTMLGLALAMGNDVELLGRKVSQGKVLLAAAEGTEHLGPRIEAWERHWGQPISDAHVTAMEGTLLSAGMMQKVLAEHRRQKFDLIIFDTFAALFAVDNENDNSQVSRIMRQLKELRDAVPGTCVVLVHHTTNTVDHRGRKQSKARGASSIRNDADTVLLLSGTRDSITISTDPEESGKQRDAMPLTIKGLCLRQVGNAVVLAEQTTAEQQRHKNALVRFLQAFTSLEHEWGSEALQRHLDIKSNDTFKDLRTEALNGGLVVKGQGNKGKYRLTAEGFRVANEGIRGAE